MVDTVEQQNPYTLGELRAEVKKLFARGGDSDIDDDVVDNAINASEKYICARIGAPQFLEYTDTLTIPANTGTVTLPVNVKDVFTCWDQANNRSLDYIDRQRWNNFIVDPSESSGQPLGWTKFGYARRTNVGSPSQPYGAMQLSFWPQPTSAFVINYDCILRAGCMVLDSDFPVTPIDFHYGLIQLTLYHLGPYDIGQKLFAQAKELAFNWVTEIVREARRDLAGNQRFIPREEYRLRKRTNVTPLTRHAQLYGGTG